ncbi:hypothetical protein EIK79_04790 [Halocatena pleomorpha]|uniref:Uncharacterized protein n=1 Tax=Halocatena pleomorpha TaxID=1785090 RepID=A0A3P3RGN9_9EURY|nr:hypothetical protein EIK79_04790 [Halocatena pleomorpha]
MGLIASIKDSISKLFSGSEPKRIGIYGPPNAGKCLAADEEVLLWDGARRSIKDIYLSARATCPDAPDVSDSPHERWIECSEAGIRVPALTEELTVAPATVSHVFRQRYQGEMYRVQTSSGSSVVVSPEHPFIVRSDGHVTQQQAQTLSVGSHVARFPTAPRDPLDRWSSGLGGNETGGRFIADGGVHTVVPSPPTATAPREHVTWEPVVSIDTVEYDGVIYDLTVPEHHTFTTSDGLVVHNTTLANRVARDWTGDAVGPESHVPHETRRARRKENVEIERNGSAVTIDIVDTPGVTTKVDYNEFLEHDMTKEDAVRRSREATEGVAEAMHWLREDVDGVVYVLDSTTDPFTQVNTMLVGIIESRDLPVLIFANKIDLDDASVQRIANAFPQHEVVPLSALEGDNMEQVYDKIANHFG